MSLSILLLSQAYMFVFVKQYPLWLRCTRASYLIYQTNTCTYLDLYRVHQWDVYSFMETS